MSQLNEVIARSVDAQDAPFLVAAVGDRDGVKWSGAAGESAPGKSAAHDTVFRIFSMTKAVGSTAAMILMDRGKLDPATPVEAIIPEFARSRSSTASTATRRVFAPRAPKPRSATSPRIPPASLTSSGIRTFPIHAGHRPSLDPVRPEVVASIRSSSIPASAGITASASTGSVRSSRRSTDARSTASAARKFSTPANGRYAIRGRGPHGRPARRRVDQRRRREIRRHRDRAPPHPEFYGMGHCLYSTAPDYMRFLRMYLNKGQLDGRRLLSENAVETLLANQIGDLKVGMLKTVVPPITADAEFFPGRRKKHSMAFMRIEEDVPGMRSAGSQFWAGVLNTHFWFDPKNNVAGGVDDPVASLRGASVHGRIREVRTRRLRTVAEPARARQARPSGDPAATLLVSAAGISGMDAAMRARHGQPDCRHTQARASPTGRKPRRA